MDETTRCHLVLVGGGHTHVIVLKSLAMRRDARLRVTLVSPDSYATYSGMIPGVLAGQYDLRAAQIDARALAARAAAGFVPDRVVRIDAQARILQLAERPPLSYDLVSFDIGSQPSAADRIEGGAPSVVMVKPIERAAAGIMAAFAKPPPDSGRRAVVVGGGAGGVEIALALAARLRREGKGSVSVCDSADQPVVERGARTSQQVLRAFSEYGIDFRGGVEALHVRSNGVELSDGHTLAADLVVWATGASGPQLFATSGLPVDERGFLRVGDELRCAEHPEIFAAGDCASLASYPELAKAGVYAVREGPILAANLRAAARRWEHAARNRQYGNLQSAAAQRSVVRDPSSVLRPSRLKPFRPQRQFLVLLNTGDGRAIFSYRGRAWRGRWAWWLKNRIDRTFIRRFARPPLQAAPTMDQPMIACGGCAAKVGADVLTRVLAKLPLARAADVLIGVTEADDAAVFKIPPGMLSVATVDAFPPFMDDLYVVGQVAASNAASDLYAMGAEAAAALALVCLPRGDAGHDEELLEQFLRGALLQLDRLGIPLAGGHTIAGEQPLVGFSMHGWVAPGQVLRKGGARAGDVLVLGKPLGTGVILAAARAGAAAAEWVEGAIASMLRSNAPLMRLLVAHGVRACTDITGFGLAGHLAEMLRASGVGARLSRDSIPPLPGARELLQAGWRSSFHESNQRAQAQVSADIDPLWLDPQTSGGLLAAVPAQHVEALSQACAEAGEPLHVIGTIIEGAGQITTD